MMTVMAPSLLLFLLSASSLSTLAFAFPTNAFGVGVPPPHVKRQKRSSLLPSFSPHQSPLYSTSTTGYWSSSYYQSNGTMALSPPSSLVGSVVALPLPKWGTKTVKTMATTTEKTLQQHQQQQQQRRFKVYCDLDGVLVDFEHGIRNLFPEYYFTSSSSSSLPSKEKKNNKKSMIQLQDLERSTLWQRVAAADSFFEKLPWAPGGKELWDEIRHLRPDILTGVPQHREGERHSYHASLSSRRQKYQWCLRELGLQVVVVGDGKVAGDRGRYNTHVWKHVDMVDRWGGDYDHVNRNNNNKRHEDKNGASSSTTTTTTSCRVITCWSTHKHLASGPGAVLIDDRECLKQNWEAKGGIFIHHQTGNVHRTLEQLRTHGILPSCSPTSTLSASSCSSSSAAGSSDDNMLFP